MAACMTGNVDDFELGFERVVGCDDGNLFAAFEWMIHGGDVLKRGAIDGEIGAPDGAEDFANTTNVVGVVMSEQDGAQLVAALSQVTQDRRGLTRIDDDGLTTLTDDPDIVVAKCWEAQNFRYVFAHSVFVQIG